MPANRYAMLDFDLGAEIDMLRDTRARLRRRRDRAARRRRSTATTSFPRDLWPQAGRARPARHHRRGGVWRRRHGLSRACRGDGGDQPRLGLGRACPMARIPTSASTRSAATAPRRRSARYLPKLISGEHVGALAMSEPGAGSDVVSHAPARREARATATCSTAARCGSPTAPMPTRWWSMPRPIPGRGPRGITAFIVEKGMKGFSHGAEARQARHARLAHGELVFEDCEVPEENVLGAVERGRAVC